VGILSSIGLSLDNAATAQCAIAATVATKESPRPRYVPQSGAGTRIFGGYIDSLDPNNETAGNKWYGSHGEGGIVGKMLQDPHIRKARSYVSGPICAGDSTFVATSTDPLDVEIADFCKMSFLENLKWTEIEKRIINGYISNGHSIEEMTDDNCKIDKKRFPLHKGNGVGLVPTGVHQIQANTIERWNQSKQDPARLESIDQWIPGSDTEDPGFRNVKADRFLRWSYDQEGANFVGFPLMRSMYGPWKLKMLFQVIDAIKHERTGVGTPLVIGSEDATDEDLDDIEVLLAEMRANEKGSMVLRYGYEFSWEGATQSDGTNINQAIERCNKDIAYAASAGFMLLGLTGKTGSYALGSTQQGNHHITVDSESKFFTGVFNLGSDGWSPIARIVRANYGDEVSIPKLQIKNLPTKPWLQIIPILTSAKQAGLITYDEKLENQIRDALTFDPLDKATMRDDVVVPAPMLETEEDDDEDETEEEVTDEE